MIYTRNLSRANCLRWSHSLRSLRAMMGYSRVVSRDPRTFWRPKRSWSWPKLRSARRLIHTAPWVMADQQPFSWAPSSYIPPLLYPWKLIGEHPTKLIPMLFSFEMCSERGADTVNLQLGIGSRWLWQSGGFKRCAWWWANQKHDQKWCTPCEILSIMIITWGEFIRVLAWIPMYQLMSFPSWRKISILIMDHITHHGPWVWLKII